MTNTPRVLILGASGMLGHKLMQRLGTRFEVTGAVRAAAGAYRDHPILGTWKLVGDVRVEDHDSVVWALETARPDVVVNAIGLIKQLPGAQEVIPSMRVNALFPHRLWRLCRLIGARLFQISTDCVFSGRAGNYAESDEPDPRDVYGRTKLLGEVCGPGAVTLRTSIVGRELRASSSLFEWFIGQRGGCVRGYRRAVYSGLTTPAFADVIADLIGEHHDLHGLWHVASAPVTKYDLLGQLDEALDLGITIEPDDDFACDRSLDGSRFAEATGFRAPTWPEMIHELAQDPTDYQRLRDWTG